MLASKATCKHARLPHELLHSMGLLRNACELVTQIRQAMARKFHQGVDPESCLESPANTSPNLAFAGLVGRLGLLVPRAFIRG